MEKHLNKKEGEEKINKYLAYGVATVGIVTVVAGVYYFFSHRTTDQSAAGDDKVADVPNRKNSKAKASDDSKPSNKTNPSGQQGIVDAKHDEDDHDQPAVLQRIVSSMAQTKFDDDEQDIHDDTHSEKKDAVIEDTYTKELNKYLLRKQKIQYFRQWRYRQGVLQVTVVKGIDLDSKDINGFSDPYVKLSIGKQKRTTTVKKKNTQSCVE